MGKEFKLENYNVIHFTGIGGVSMSAMAQILLKKGYKVQGSDKSESELLENLRNAGAKIFLGHRKENIDGADLVVYTDAVDSSNPEIVRAGELKIPTMGRAAFLGKLMKEYKTRIVISGTHGKTTTTGMISKIVLDGSKDPTILLGGNLDEIDGNVRVGGDEIFITEGCEYKNNIKFYNPTICVILNIDSDHLDFFKDIDDVLKAFTDYVSRLGSSDCVVINRDTYGYEKLAEKSKAKVVSFGETSLADFVIGDLKSSDKTTSFSITHEGFKRDVKLKVMGIHNAYNAAAAIIGASLSGIPIDEAVKKVETYHGVHRRLERKGEVSGITVYDDYAHHPTEIQASLLAVKEIKTGKIFAVFQPHTFTRTKLLLKLFGVSFKDSDEVIITDIYAAREIDDHSIHSKDLVREIQANGKKAVYLSTFEEILDYLKKTAKKDDIVLTMGAGNIYELGELYLKTGESS